MSELLQQLPELQVQMLKFAVSQLRDEALAEDVVQEALSGAVKNADKFAGQSALKTWVFAILKNKIRDAIRYKQRQAERSVLMSDVDVDFSADLFDHTGHWAEEHKPMAWSDPEGLAESEDFWQVFDTCLNVLPAQQGQVFMMRELLDLDSAEICRELELSTSNLHVLLYRARLRLQECLAQNWFDGEVSHA